MDTMLNPWPGSFLDPMPWLANPFVFSFGAPAPARAPEAAGNFTSSQLDTPFGTLGYKLYVPSCAAGQAMPLLVMLHGCGQDAEDFARGTDMNTLAEEMGCLVAYPEQSAGANSNRCWNWFDDAHHHRDRGEPAMIAGITRAIMDEYAVDPARVFVAGLSAGAAMAVVLGRTYPELYTAVGCHSGLAYACATDMSAALAAMRDGPRAASHDSTVAALPIIVFHGDQDATVHPRNSMSVVAQCVDGGRCSELPMLAEQGETTGRAFTRQVYQSASGQVLAEQWLVHGTGHAWSGGNRRGSYTDAAGPNASAEMLRFFLSMRPD